MRSRLAKGLYTRVLAWAAICILSATIVFGVKDGVERSAIRQLQAEGERRLDIYVQSLNGELGRYDYLPTVIALNANVTAMLQNPDDQELRKKVNEYLQDVNESARSSAVYILDHQGVTLASSNWNDDISFVGVKLDYRPYFLEALKSAHGRFYGIGTTSGIPGYFRSSPIIHDGRLLGVMALKVSLEQLEGAWEEGRTKSREIVAVADKNGIIFLSSRNSWKYKTTKSLDPPALEQIRASRQYDSAALKPLELVVVRSTGSAPIIRFNEDMPDRYSGSSSRKFLEQIRSVDSAGWRILLFSDLEPQRRFALSVAIACGLAIGAAIFLTLYLHQRWRALNAAATAKEALQVAHDRLEQDVADRTADLVQTNQQLHREIVERNRTEVVLREARAGLVHAEKLAALGQMSAGIAHELNQPLTAVRTLSDNAKVLLERNRLQAATANLSKISELSEHMGQIVAH
ncbi:sensor histidine kinase [Methylobacterium sp. WSM2598]|uniref:sensor histidine kinase n=1 Tax=Methylobacterium sp. WSM2598 TaxID=398261 RepID=UPI00039E5072|nr:cache domain-containing protein [Methylobacterium sp. WSM2598]